MYIGINATNQALTDELVEFTNSANPPPYSHQFPLNPALTVGVDGFPPADVTLCGYLSGWSFKQIPVASTTETSFIPETTQNGIRTIVQWGDLGLQHLDLNYLNQNVGFSSYFTNVTANDTPNLLTLTSVSYLHAYFTSNSNPVTNLIPKMATWDMSNVLEFDGMFFVSSMRTTDITGISNWRLNKVKPSTFKSMFQSMSSTLYTNISVADWNPVVGSMDYAFRNQNVVYPNITTWTLMPNVCANGAFDACNLVTSTLFDALLIKFANQTSSINCQWENIRANATSASAAARLTLCQDRGWLIQRQNPGSANFCCPGGLNC